MRDAGRKLTIRMPDTERLRDAVVARIHVESGSTVRGGNPVMTLRMGEHEHVVRAPRVGLVYPLVITGDRVASGDALFTLSIDETALARENLSARQRYAVERVRGTRRETDAAGADPMTLRVQGIHDSSLVETTSSWAKPALALALVMLACFVVLPILNTFGRDASFLGLGGMFFGCVLFGLVIFQLYGTEGRPWALWTVRLIALAWVGVSSAVLFGRPFPSYDIIAAGPAPPALTAPSVPAEALEPATVDAAGTRSAPAINVPSSTERASGNPPSPNVTIRSRHAKLMSLPVLPMPGVLDVSVTSAASAGLAVGPAVTLPRSPSASTGQVAPHGVRLRPRDLSRRIPEAERPFVLAASDRTADHGPSERSAPTITPAPDRIRAAGLPRDLPVVDEALSGKLMAASLGVRRPPSIAKLAAPTSGGTPSAGSPDRQVAVTTLPGLTPPAGAVPRNEGWRRPGGGARWLTTRGIPVLLGEGASAPAVPMTSLAAMKAMPGPARGSVPAGLPLVRPPELFAVLAIRHPVAVWKAVLPRDAAAGSTHVLSNGATGAVRRIVTPEDLTGPRTILAGAPAEPRSQGAPRAMVMLTDRFAVPAPAGPMTRAGAEAAARPASTPPPSIAEPGNPDPVFFLAMRDGRDAWLGEQQAKVGDGALPVLPGPKSDASGSLPRAEPIAFATVTEAAPAITDRRAAIASEAPAALAVLHIDPARRAGSPDRGWSGDTASHRPIVSAGSPPLARSGISDPTVLPAMPFAGNGWMTRRHARRINDGATPPFGRTARAGVRPATSWAAMPDLPALPHARPGVVAVPTVAVVAILSDEMSAKPVPADVETVGARSDLRAVEHAATPARPDPADGPGPVMFAARRAADPVWMLERIARAEGGLHAPDAVADPAFDDRPAAFSDRRSASRRERLAVPAAGIAPRVAAVAAPPPRARPLRVPADTDYGWTGPVKSAAPGRFAGTAQPATETSLDPVMIAALRAAAPVWMFAQADRLASAERGRVERRPPGPIASGPALSAIVAPGMGLSEPVDAPRRPHAVSPVAERAVRLALMPARELADQPWARRHAPGGAVLRRFPTQARAAGLPDPAASAPGAPGAPAWIDNRAVLPASKLEDRGPASHGGADDAGPPKLHLTPRRTAPQRPAPAGRPLVLANARRVGAVAVLEGGPAPLAAPAQAPPAPGTTAGRTPERAGLPEGPTGAAIPLALRRGPGWGKPPHPAHPPRPEQF